jgi:hypothetical protein
MKASQWLLTTALAITTLLVKAPRVAAFSTSNLRRTTTGVGYNRLPVENDGAWKQQQQHPQRPHSWILEVNSARAASNEDNPTAKVIQIEDLPQAQIVELIEVTFINACMVRMAVVVRSEPTR